MKQDALFPFASVHSFGKNELYFEEPAFPTFCVTLNTAEKSTKDTYDCGVLNHLFVDFTVSLIGTLIITDSVVKYCQHKTRKKMHFLVSFLVASEESLQSGPTSLASSVKRWN